MAKEQEYVSAITKNPCQDSQLFDFVSDFRNIASILPAEAKEKATFTQDSIIVQAMAGMSVTFKILEQEPNKLIKLGTEQNDMFRLWIQLKQVAPYDTRIRITLRTNVPLVARAMLKKEKLQSLVDGLAQALGQIPVYAFQGNKFN